MPPWASRSFIPSVWESPRATYRWNSTRPLSGGGADGIKPNSTERSALRKRLHHVVRRQPPRQVLDLLTAVAEQVVDGGQAGGEVADGVLRGHADAAVELDRLLADVAPGLADLELRAG